MYVLFSVHLQLHSTKAITTTIAIVQLPLLVSPHFLVDVKSLAFDNRDIQRRQTMTTQNLETTTTTATTRHIKIHNIHKYNRKYTYINI